MPASGISIATSSGVSMLSWSELRSVNVHGANPLQPVDSQAPAPLGPALCLCWPNPTRAAWASSPAPNCRRWPCSTARWPPTSRCCARTRPPAPTPLHVNQLLARAHHIIYSGRKTNLLTLFRFLRDEYPAIFQRQIGYVLASLLVSVAWGCWAPRSPTPAPSSCATLSARR